MGRPDGTGDAADSAVPGRVDGSMVARVQEEHCHYGGCSRVLKGVRGGGGEGLGCVGWGSPLPPRFPGVGSS